VRLILCNVARKGAAVGGRFFVKCLNDSNSDGRLWSYLNFICNVTVLEGSKSVVHAQQGAKLTFLNMASLDQTIVGCPEKDVQSTSGRIVVSPQIGSAAFRI
jgi:hypothetical protein